jgi:hypothetical protein
LNFKSNVIRHDFSSFLKFSFAVVILLIASIFNCSNVKVPIFFTAEARRTQRSFSYLPLIRQTDRRTGKAANENPQPLRGGICIPLVVLWASTNQIQCYFARRAVVFHFLVSLPWHIFSDDRSPESEKKNQLCVLGASSAAGGETI